MIYPSPGLSAMIDLKACIESIKKCEILTESQMRTLCKMVFNDPIPFLILKK